MKFSVEDGYELPAPTELAGPGTDGERLTWSEPTQHVLRATYFDTADVDLARHGLTLRRRVGGTDAGWHLKVPAAGSERSEVRLPPGRSGRVVPAALQRLVRVRTMGQPLVPVATITTHRAVRRLVDASNHPLLELADDRVVARRLLPLAGSAEAADEEVWREIEIEALDAGEELLTSVAAALRARTLTRAPYTSKLARVLQIDEDAEPASGTTAKPASAPAGRSHVALGYVCDQLEQLRAQDLRVRLDVPGSVHIMRVATRRLRSALTTFRSSFGSVDVGPLRDELKWLAGVLGAVRDAEVMHDRVLGVLRGEDARAELSPVAAEVDAQLRSAHATAREAALHELDGERYDRLLDDLEAFVRDLPTTTRGNRSAGRVLQRGVAEEYARLRRLVKRAIAATEPEQRDELLHDARKAAKRTRYAAELATAVCGPDARAFAAAMESVQELLGQHQDSVVLRRRLRELAESTTDPNAAFAYGRLHALEEVRAHDIEARVPSVWAAAKKKRLRRWLR